MLSDYEYNPNEIESDIFLSQIPLNLMKENIKSQFKDPLEYRKKDHITTFINKYRMSKQNLDLFEDEDKDNLIELRDNFYAFMQLMFRNYLGIGINNFDTMDEETQDDMIHYIYRFFLINIKRNFFCLIMNYIEKNKESFIIDEEKRKDVTSLSFKKEIDDYDVYILGNLNSLIHQALKDDIDVDEFFEKCDDTVPCLETEFMKKNFDNFTITGNFISNYIEMVDNEFISELESKIRNRILKKYKNK